MKPKLENVEHGFKAAAHYVNIFSLIYSLQVCRCQLIYWKQYLSTFRLYILNLIDIGLKCILYCVTFG